jgi:hypothetical protein
MHLLNTHTAHRKPGAPEGRLSVRPTVYFILPQSVESVRAELHQVPFVLRQKQMLIENKENHESASKPTKEFLMMQERQLEVTASKLHEGFESSVGACAGGVDAAGWVAPLSLTSPTVTGA